MGIEPGITFAEYLELVGERWIRGIDGTNTADPYRAGLGNESSSVGAFAGAADHRGPDRQSSDRLEIDDDPFTSINTRLR